MSLLQDAFLYSHGLNSIFGLIMAILSIRIFMYTRIKLVLYMFTLMVSWFLTNLLLILPIFLKLNYSNPNDIDIINLIASVNIIGSGIVPAIFIIFIDAFEGELDNKKIATAIFTISASFFIAIIGFIYNIEISSTIVIVDDLITMRWSPISSLAIFPTVLLAGIWAQSELKKSKSHIFSSIQMRQIRFMQFGSLFAFIIAPIFGIIGVVLVDAVDELILGTWASEIIGYAFVSIGVAFLSISYISSKVIGYLKPQKLDSMLVLYDTGIPVYKHEFLEGEETADLVLASGAISAIISIMAEAFSTTSLIEEISFANKKLLLNFKQVKNTGDKLAFILICENSSVYLRKVLEICSSEFTSTFEDMLDTGRGFDESEKTLASNIILKSVGLQE